MEPIQKASDLDNMHRTRTEKLNSPPSQDDQIKDVSKKTIKYPPNSTVTKLDSTLEIKQTWIYNEWDERCQFSKYIRPQFPNRDALKNLTDSDLLKLTFHEVRGKYNLWKVAKEQGRWKKIVVPNLNPDWVKENIKILYPTPDCFDVSELHGLVLWKESKTDTIYQLLEGNHRVSAWLASENPQPVPATIFIGKPGK